MVENIISEIKAAECEAREIILRAERTAKSLEIKNQADIDALVAASQNLVNEQIAKLRGSAKPLHSGKNAAGEIRVDGAKFDAAKEFIIKSFEERFCP